MPTNEKEITKEQIYEAMKCNTAEELQAYAKTQGYDITLEEANAYMAELEDVELDETVLNKTFLYIFSLYPTHLLYV